MINEKLRMTPPTWSQEVDDGGMFPSRLSVHEDPDGGSLPFLAVARNGWGGGGNARRATLQEAIAYAETLHEKLTGAGSSTTRRAAGEVADYLAECADHSEAPEHDG